MARAGWRSTDDQFLRWLHTGSGTIANSGGIRFRDFVGKSEIDPATNRRIPAYFVLVTAEKRTQFHNPWDDVVDHVAGQIWYWGDAKYVPEGRSPDQFTGNARVIAAHNAQTMRGGRYTTPFIHFSKPQMGWLRFNGLCVLEDLRHTWFEDSGQPVRNIRLTLSILDCDGIDPAWLRARETASDTPDADRLLAPEAWRRATAGEVRRRHIFAARVRKPVDQIPPPESDDSKILQEVQALSPEQFENFVVALIEKLPELVTGLAHQIFRTRRTGDHGVDFFGQFTLPWPVAYEIEFAGEAKRQKSAITPDQVSRLVARLGRGQYGLYFTTSFYTEQAQREVIMDRYPVRLFTGQDLVNILRATNCISGSRLRADWKEVAILRPPRSSLHTGLFPRP